MAARKHCESAYLALKAAARRLIGSAGGLEAAANVTRVSKASLGFYTQPTHDQHMPADVIADLEADIGDPVITRELARLSGYALVPEGTVKNSQLVDPAHMVSKLARDLGEFAQSVEDMDEDGVREAHEIRRCLEEMNDLLDRAAKCRDGLYEHLVALQPKSKA